MTANLYIRDFATRSIIKTIPLSSTDDRYVEKVMMGIMHNMNLDDYFVDDSEVYPDESKEDN